MIEFNICRYERKELEKKVRRDKGVRTSLSQFFAAIRFYVLFTEAKI